MAEPKLIVLDLETMPNLVEAFKVWTQLSSFPGKTLKASIQSIICGGWKEIHSDKVHCINAWDFPDWENDINDDKKICKAIYDVLIDADAVITQNGKRFDWKFLQTRLLINGLDPLPKIKHIDIMQEARKNLLMFNNRLGTLGKHLVKDDKLENGGWELWFDVYNRKKKSMKLMEKYCKQDVLLTDKIFKRLRPLINNIPNYNMYSTEYTGGKKVCPKCGGTRLKSKGPYVSGLSMYRRYRCQSCGGYSREPMKSNVPRSL